MDILHTERLTLCEFSMDDAPFILELLNSPGWLRYIGDRGVRTLEDAQRYIADRFQASYKKNGFGLWLVKLKDSGAALGSCGLIRRDFLPHADIGFAFLPQYIGKGYALEAAEATMSYAREELKLGTIAAITVHDNEPSKKLLQKLGMAYAGMIAYPGEEEELMLYQAS